MYFHYSNYKTKVFEKIQKMYLLHIVMQHIDIKATKVILNW